MRNFSRVLAGLAFILCVCSGAFAQQYDISVQPGAQTIPLLKGSYGLSGEVQSTVVAPNLKSECKAGRFLISMDTVRPPQSGTVIGRDLNLPGSPDIRSTFSGDPDSTHELFGTNDDDIITMPNGDVLLLWGVHINPKVSPLPGWFNHTYANDGKFGPGARRGTVVYRSTDCGNSFQYMTRIDPAQLGDGACGNPQPSDTPTPLAPPYVNGGSDGQLARIQNGTVYFTMDCGGRLQDTSKPGWVISNNFVGRTYALRSTNEFASFRDLGYLPGLNGDAGWRTGVVPLSTGDIAFGVGNFLMFGRKQPNGTYKFSGTRTSASTAFDWSDINSNPVFADIDGKFKNGKPDPRQIANTLLTRVPGGDDVMLVYPAVVKDGNNVSLDGYEIYFYDPSTGQFGQANPVFPVVHAANHFLMHMVAIDPGSGPILLYWDDVDGKAMTATMRGRFIYANGSYSSDFPVATNAAKAPDSFAMAHAWYGDYHTAGGFATGESSRGGGTGPHLVSEYFPVWVQSDGLARFSRVSVDLLPLQKETRLFVGTQPNCNAGVVTTNPNHLNCATRPIGFTVDRVSAVPAANFTPVFVGNQPNVNDGVASTNPHHLNGSTAPIGFLSKIPTEGGTKLFVGNVQNCNAGVLTTNMNHLNCATSFVGYTLPQQ